MSDVIFILAWIAFYARNAEWAYRRTSRSSSLPKSTCIDLGMRLVICPAKSYHNSRSFVSIRG